MIRPFRARYGNRDKSHDLLDWDGAPLVLPRALLGLTDRPPNASGPDAYWWPSVGCGPIEGIWALWWTEPDESAARGGMVRSEVAVWRLEDIGGVDDLRPVMQSIGGEKPILVPSADVMAAIVDALLSDHTVPPVLLDLELWPGVIAALWTRLWPEARCAFSARVAFAPPQGSESVSPPWLYGVPAKQALPWSKHRQIATTTTGTKLNRAGLWLIGTEDPTFVEVFRACPFRPSNLEKLTTVARAADRLDQLRAQPSIENGRDLLRVLAVLAPQNEAANSLKMEALAALQHDFAAAPWKFIVSLGSLDLAHVPNARVLSTALDAWMTRHATDLTIENATRMLNALQPDRSQMWWQEAVGSALAASLAEPKTAWAKAGLQWLSLAEGKQSLDALLPSTANVEKRLFDVFSEVGIDRPHLEILRGKTVARRWSRLHALIAQATLQPDEAFRAQWVFPDDALAGMAVLVERLPGTVVVDETLALGHSAIIPLVAKRTAREPVLLQSLDSRIPTWRAMWAAHIDAGGTHWPPGVNRSVAARGLLDAAIARNDVDKLVVALAEGLAAAAFEDSRRASLWEALGPKARTALLEHTANALIHRCNAGDTISAPEKPLLDSFLTTVRRTRPPPQTIVILLRWKAPIGEDEIIQWLTGSKDREWGPVAHEFGQAVAKRRWTRVAKAIYDRAWTTRELRIAAANCSDLLSGLDFLLVKFWTGSSAETNTFESALADKVADLGATLAPDRLELLWERAGGERKRLRDWGTPDAQWRYATNLAQSGALRGGLAPLVAQLRADFPHNIDLQRVSTALGNRG